MAGWVRPEIFVEIVIIFPLEMAFWDSCPVLDPQKCPHVFPAGAMQVKADPLPLPSAPTHYPNAT